MNAPQTTLHFGSQLKVDQALVDRALLEIFTYLDKQDRRLDPGLLSGSSGYALFNWYLAKRRPDLATAGYIESWINDIQESIPPNLSAAGFAGGLSGIGSFFELLLQEQDDPYDGSYNENTDRILSNAIREAPWTGELEYIQGLSGIAVYASRRARMGRALPLYERIVQIFEARAHHPAKDRCTWSTPPGSRYRERPEESGSDLEFNLGLAHGVPAMISALIPALGHEMLRERAAPMVVGACEWLIDQAQDAREHESYFSYYAHRRATSRLGWCYGDLGVAITLARAGMALANPGFVDAARRFGQAAATRLSDESAQVCDAAICHGSAGLALMFALLHRLTGDDAVLRASQYWLDDLQQRYDGAGLDGFNTSRTTPDLTQRELVPTAGLLEGYAGIGLSLLAFTGVEPKWVDLLQLG